MRAFIALELPKEIKIEIGKIQNRLKSAGIKAAWVKEEQCHLTLIFWEDFPEEKISFLVTILQRIFSNRSSFPLTIGKLDAFPRQTCPRVLILKVEDNSGKLKSLANSLKDSLIKAKLYQEEKPFASHLTLGRISEYKKAPITLPKVGTILSFSAQKITLIKSQLTKEGPIHTPLQVFLLRS